VKIFDILKKTHKANNNSLVSVQESQTKQLYRARIFISEEISRIIGALSTTNLNRKRGFTQ
jgi:hypothetical protein